MAFKGPFQSKAFYDSSVCELTAPRCLHSRGLGTRMCDVCKNTCAKDTRFFYPASWTISLCLLLWRKRTKITAVMISSWGGAEQG